MILRILHWLSRGILAGIFLYTGFHKIFPRGEATFNFAIVLSGYKLFPENIVWYIAEYFPWIEIALAVFLLMGWKIRYVAGAATGLMLFFLTILAITYARGIDANCGCFSFNDKISPLTIARDGIIIFPALYLLAEPLLRERLKSKN